MDDNLHKQMVFEENRKSTGVAYLLWLFLGWFGVHRFYTGNTKSGAIQLVLTLTGIGFLLVTFWWWLFDALLVPGLVNERNRNTIDMINASMSYRDGEHVEEPRRIETEADRKREAMLEDLRQTGYRKERRSDFSQLYR
ncbi:TM2 domain-containing protein [Erythrobacter sp. KY5]|uniref:TM2 domain-containing protein n=1 Tax=Erythrobacter sp. KY5 TaxID=2011159 RepID=UPI001F3AFAFA|nr:TM2 domain-containing protein [Erythrobacter sp. KY5]